MKGEEAMASRRSKWGNEWEDEVSGLDRKRRSRPDLRRKNSRSFEFIDAAEKKKKRVRKPFGVKPREEALRGDWHYMSAYERLEENEIHPSDLDEDLDPDLDASPGVTDLEDSEIDYSPDDDWQ
jgi:hypothetical protein